MYNIIKQYIDKITINNINDFAIKNNCFLNKNELNTVFSILKNNYEDILNGKDTSSISLLEKNLTSDNFEKIIRLYNEYKVKYQSFL